MECKTHGFSLIDLLILVRIIGLIASIAIPNHLAPRSQRGFGPTIAGHA